MKPKALSAWKAVVNGLMLIFFLGCSPGASPEPDFIPNLAQLWHDSVDNGQNFTHWITWSYFPDCPSPAPCKNEGYFTGSDRYRQGNIWEVSNIPISRLDRAPFQHMPQSILSSVNQFS